MSTDRSHAMLLSAGRGTRLRPLTDHTPKPLLEIGAETLLDRHLRKLAAAGFTDVTINLHHLAAQIRAHVGKGSRHGVRIHFTDEAELLETGGGIQAVLERFGDAPFAVISADLWTDYPYAALREPLPTGMLARLVLVRSHLGQDFGFAHTPPPGQVAAFSPTPVEKFTYGSLGTFSPRLFDGAPGGAYPLRDLLFPALARGQLCGSWYDGAWFNIGSARELADVRAFAAAFAENSGASDSAT